MKILLVGNSGSLSKDKGGQTAKFRLYKKKIVDEGFDLATIDLENFFKTPFSILKNIKKELEKCDRVVLISGERACRLLIPFINKYNKKKLPFVLPLVGSGVLHFSIDHLKSDDHLKFFNGNYSLGKRKLRIEKELHKITYILPETTLMNKIYSDFYSLDNCFVLNNFREIGSLEYKNPTNNIFRIIYLSRVMEIKGIFDLLDVAEEIRKEGIKFELDIYGDLDMDDKEKHKFYSSLSESINYKNSICNSEAIETLSKYDLFIFPTKYFGEGAPGVIAESLLAGTPILTSDFPQARFLLKDGVDSIFYKMFDKEDLKSKLIQILKNKDILKTIREGAIEAGKKFTYEYERTNFLKYVCGVDETK